MELEHSKVQEKKFLGIFEQAFVFFQLEDLVKIICLSKGFMEALSQSPRLFILILKKYYLSKDHLHPKIRRYFKILLTKRPEIDDSNLSGVAKEIHLLARYRINISKNLIRDVYCEKNPQNISEIDGRSHWKSFLKKSESPMIERTHGGNGWLLEKEIIPEFQKRTLASSFGWCEIVYKAFFKEFSADFLQDFTSGRSIIKAGCFISRREDCEAQGGCVLTIFDFENNLLFKMEQHKKSEEIPTSGGSNFSYIEIAFQVSSKDLPENIDLEKCGMTLTIYGKDERFWRGHYGSRFSAMYIRGDFAENPLAT